MLGISTVPFAESVMRSQISIILIWKRHLLRLVHFLLVLVHELLVDLDLGRSESGRSNELQLGITDELASEPEEGLLEVVVGLG